jgi:hypothetical protein
MRGTVRRIARPVAAGTLLSCLKPGSRLRVETIAALRELMTEKERLMTEKERLMTEKERLMTGLMTRMDEQLKDTKELHRALVAEKDVRLVIADTALLQAQAQLAAAKGQLGRRSAYEMGLRSAWNELSTAGATDFLDNNGTPITRFPGKGKFNATDTEAWLGKLKTECADFATLQPRFPTVHCVASCVTVGLYAVLSQDVHGQALDIDKLVNDPGPLSTAQHDCIKCVLRCLGVTI